MTVLTKDDCEVTATTHHQNLDGGLYYAGLLWVRGKPVASFENEGRGGCDRWDVRTEHAHLLAEFDELAVRECPDVRFEQRDHLAGLLWDAAVLKPQPKTRKRKLS
jgi:hypothetical protein